MNILRFHKFLVAAKRYRMRKLLKTHFWDTGACGEIRMGEVPLKSRETFITGYVCRFLVQTAHSGTHIGLYLNWHVICAMTSMNNDVIAGKGLEGEIAGASISTAQVGAHVSHRLRLFISKPLALCRRRSLHQWRHIDPVSCFLQNYAALKLCS